MAHPSYVKEIGRLTPARDVKTAMARTLMLASSTLEDASQAKWLTFPMRGRKGLFEIRIEGVRFYGARVGAREGRAVVVMLGGEQKSGKSKADTSLLDRCEEAARGLKEAIGE